MGCSGCSSGRGHYNTPSGVPAGCNNNGACGTGGCNKLNVFDWLANMELPSGQTVFDVVEVRFKNSRKEFFKNAANIPLAVGDVVAVEASPGHDMGVISLTGELVRLQMKKRGLHTKNTELKKIYRKAKQQDIDKWKEAQELEVPTMYKARTFALQHKLEMKISDVEYQGDKTKAIFYYTADGRVDFRELIKTLAEQFRVRIEMRQIGARQEASRLGGIGACGRELCCSTWLTDFRTVSTSAARYQQLSLNPLKLAGQCGKLKCCLNYELDSYMDALKDFPETERIKLKSNKGDAFHQKTDIFKRLMWYSYTSEPDHFIELSVNRVKEVMAMNAKGELPEQIEDAHVKTAPVKKEPDYENVVGQDSLTRFDKKSKGDRQKHKGNKQRKPNQAAAHTNRPQKPQGQGGNKNSGSKEQGGNKGNNQQSGRNNQNRNKNRNNPNHAKKQTPPPSGPVS